jgi:hypothetical protein
VDDARDQVYVQISGEKVEDGGNAHDDAADRHSPRLSVLFNDGDGKTDGDEAGAGENARREPRHKLLPVTSFA